jgi:hypothetical protein
LNHTARGIATAQREAPAIIRGDVWETAILSKLPALLASIITLFLVGTTASPAEAQDTAGRWSSFTEINLGASWIDVRDLESGRPGLTFGIAQGIRYQRFLFSFGFDASYYLTRQPPPPYAASLRIYDVRASVGYMAPAGPLSISGEAFYELRQFRNNGLVRAIGDDPVHHGVGVASTIRYPATRSLFIALRPYYSVTPSTNQIVHEWGLLFVFGFSATID